MNYTKTEWKDLPDTSTPITSSRLNNMEDGIEYLFEHGVGGGDTLPIGIILPLSTDTIPEGYLLCDGSAISRTTYATLFSVIGTTYGEGDGSTTFNLPDLKGKTLVGQDTNDADFDTLGETGGEKTHTLTVDEMPSHNHELGFNNASAELVADGIDKGDAGRGTTSASPKWYTFNAGGGQSHNNLQPYTVVNYIIKALNAQNGEVRSESLPVGTEIDFDGTAQDIPTGWTQISPTQQILWINPDPTSSFASQTITLSSGDYDFYEVYCTYNEGTAIQYANGFKTIKGKGILITENGYGTDISVRRKIDYTDDTHLLVYDGMNGNAVGNGYLIPIYVIGYKTGLFSQGGNS